MNFHKKIIVYACISYLATSCTLEGFQIKSRLLYFSKNLKHTRLNSNTNHQKHTFQKRTMFTGFIRMVAENADKLYDAAKAASVVVGLSKIAYDRNNKNNNISTQEELKKQEAAAQQESNGNYARPVFTGTPTAFDQPIPSNSILHCYTPVPQKPNKDGIGINNAIATCDKQLEQKKAQEQSDKALSLSQQATHSAEKEKIVGDNTKSAAYNFFTGKNITRIVELKSNNSSSGSNNNSNSGSNNSQQPNNKEPNKNPIRDITKVELVRKIVIGKDNKPASTPVGRSGDSGDTLQIHSKNSPATIEGTHFSGHALDQMQSRGILSPSAVIDTVKNPSTITIGNSPGTSVYTRDNLKVVTGSKGGIITVMRRTDK